MFPPLHRLRPFALWLLVAVMAGASLGVLVALDAHAPRTGFTVPWLAATVAFAITERFPINVHFRRSSHALTLGEIPLIIALTFGHPVEVAIAWTVAVAVVLLPTRPIPVRMAYNIANVSLVTACTALGVHALAGTGDVGLWTGAALGVVGASALTVPVLSIAMALSGERMRSERIRAMLRVGVLVSSSNAGLALAIVAVLQADPWAGLLLLAPIAAVFVSYRAYTKQRRQHLELEFLYDAGRTLSGARDSASGLAGVLAMALETFHAELAEVTMLPADSEATATRVTVGPDRRVEVLEPVPPAAARQLRALVEGEPGVHVIPDKALDGVLADRLRDLAPREVMLAGLPGERRLLGTIMVANSGTVGAFGPEDRRLFETLAGHTGSTLGQEHLERRVVELREVKDKLYHQAFHDALTGLANRMLLEDRVAYAMARRTGNAVVMYIDLDDFKPINDTYGHEAGDTLLCAVAERMRASLRPSDTAARLGGDEFAVLLVDIAPHDVPTVAERILRNFEPPVELREGTARISASMGIAMADSGSMSAEELTRKADAAMYVAKRGGKRGYTIADHEALAAV